jgi:hypothetical protein
MRAKTRALTYCVAAATAGVAAMLVIPASASTAAGSTLWVSSATTVAGNGTSCAAPGFNTIQAALDAAPSGSHVNVCAGTYAEQLQITSSVTVVGIGAVSVKLPVTPVDATTACDTAPGTGSFQADQDGVSICGDITVSLSNLKVSAAWAAGTCDDSLYGILIAGGATVNMTDSAVTAAGARPLNGCQGGIGIQVGMGWTTPVEVGHLVLSHSSVAGYQKNGITVDGQGSTAQIGSTTVKGIGATQQIAQNGIQVSNLAKATITDVTVTGNECNVSVCGQNGLTQTQSTGLLFYGAARGSSVSNSTITDNDIGVYYLANPDGRAPTLPQVLISSDKITRNRYEGVVLDQGRANVTGCTITSGRIGIEVLQYNGQTFGSNSVASHNTIKLMSWASVDVLSDRAATGDKKGTFKISNSSISAAPVRDNAKNLPVTRSHDT